jgi:hypothetical protein
MNCEATIKQMQPIISNKDKEIISSFQIIVKELESYVQTQKINEKIIDDEIEKLDKVSLSSIELLNTTMEACYKDIKSGLINNANNQNTEFAKMLIVLSMGSYYVIEYFNAYNLFDILELINKLSIKHGDKIINILNKLEPLISKYQMILADLIEIGIPKRTDKIIIEKDKRNIAFLRNKSIFTLLKSIISNLTKSKENSNFMFIGGIIGVVILIIVIAVVVLQMKK